MIKVICLIFLVRGVHTLLGLLQQHDKTYPVSPAYTKRYTRDHEVGTVTFGRN